MSTPTRTVEQTKGGIVLIVMQCIHCLDVFNFACYSSIIYVVNYNDSAKVLEPSL